MELSLKRNRKNYYACVPSHGTEWLYNMLKYTLNHTFTAALLSHMFQYSHHIIKITLIMSWNTIQGPSYCTSTSSASTKASFSAS